MGYATVGEPIFYGSARQFAADYRRHRVGAQSPHAYRPGGKYGYPLLDVVAVAPVVIDSRGIVARRLDGISEEV